MGLKSLIAVAQGKNAESVSFEDKFLNLSLPQLPDLR